MLNLYNEARGEYIYKYQFDLPSGMPIVGRQRELALLKRYYKAAKHGTTHVALLSGEAGIGKTCLLNEIAHRACQDGAIVLRGSSSDAEGMPLYLPFLEALSQYIHESAPDQLQKQVTPATHSLNSILPEILSHTDVLPTHQPLLPEQMRFRLHKAVGEFLENIAFTRGLVLVLDDLQWADSASLDLLCSITRHHPNARLLIFGAYSTHKLNSHMLLERTLAELTHQRVLTMIELPPLTPGDIEALALSILQDPVSPDVGSLLYEQSEGNPFFAEELLQSWVEAGALVRTGQQWNLDTSRERVLPPGIVGLLHQRFLQLAPESICMLRLAAVIGRTFSLALLATLAKQEMETIEDHLLEAERAGLTRSSQAGVFTFCHEKIRECLYAEVSISRRQRLHETIGLALESQYYQEENAKNAQFASLVFCLMQRHELEHCQLSPQRAEAQMQQNALIKEAAHHYRTALELLPRDDQRRGYLLQRLGKVASLATCEEEAARAYADGSVLLGQLGDPKAAASAMHALGVVRWRQGLLAEAQIALERALQILGVCSCVETARVLLDLALLLTHSLEQPVEGLAYAQHSLEMAHMLENAHLETMAKQVAAGNQDVQSRDLRPIAQREELALKLAQEQGEFLDAGACCLALTKYAYWLGEIKQAYKISALRIALIESSRQLLPYQALTAYSWPALLLASQGDWLQAEQRIKQAQALVDPLAHPLPQAFLQQVRGFLAYQREDYTTAEDAFRDVLKNQARCPDKPWFFAGPLGLVLINRGKQEEASVYMAELARLLSSFPVDTLATAPLALCMALIAIATNDQERIPDLYTRLLAFQGQYYWFLVDRVLGLLAAQCGEREAALRHLSAASETALRESLRPELARIYLAQANVEGTGNDAESIERARELLKLAQALFQELGMAASYRRCSQQLHASVRAHMSPPSTPPELPAHLTSREAAILKLVASGKSNHQIAQEVAISEKTVANHLTHIFHKIACKNRAAAAAFAIRNGLA